MRDVQIRIKRIYEDPSPEDGIRILVDGLWPRGVKKEGAGIDFWLKGIAPSEGLRKSFGHDPERFEAFRESYIKELKTNSALKELISILSQHNAVTLLFAARDEHFNNAVVLLEVLQRDHLL